MSEILGISPQAVGKAAARGTLSRNKDGLYDLSDPVNKDYLREKGIAVSKITIPQTRPAGRPPRGEQRATGTIKTPSHYIDKSAAELQKIYKIAMIEKVKLETRIKREMWVPAEEQRFLFQDFALRMTRQLEMVLGGILQDAGSDIIEQGHVSGPLIFKAHGELIEKAINPAIESFNKNLMQLQKKHHKRSGANNEEDAK